MSEVEPKIRKVKNLDGDAALYERYLRCKTLRDQWQDEMDLAKLELAKVMGDAEEGHIKGRRVLTYAREDRFNSTEFKKIYPDLYRLYMRSVTRQQFDLDSFKLAQPDRFIEFQVRSLRTDD
jgi:hypothetical protein